LVTLAIIAVLILAWWVDQQSTADSASEASPPTATATASRPTASTQGVPARPADAIKLRVDYVFDGDTLRAEVLSANKVVDVNEEIRVRLIGIDIPEKGECWVDEARRALIDLAPRGSTIWGATDTEARDRYSRLLFNLWNGDGEFIQYELTRNGHAQSLRVWPNVAHNKLLVAAQRAAERDDLGQWETC